MRGIFEGRKVIKVVSWRRGPQADFKAAGPKSHAPRRRDPASEITLALRYRTIYCKVAADRNGAAYMGEALRSVTQADHKDDFVTAYADKI